MYPMPMPTYEYTSKGSVGDYTYMYVDIFNFLFYFLWSVAQLLLTFAVWSKWSTFVVLYVSQYSHALSTKQKNIELINVLFCWNEWAPTFIFVFYFWSGVGEILTVYDWIYVQYIIPYPCFMSNKLYILGGKKYYYRYM